MAEDVAAQGKIKKGLLFASLAVPVAVAVWVLLWQQGYMASLVAFGLSFGAVWLFTLGAGAAPSRKSAPWLAAVIVLGVVISFLAGMASDAWYAYTNDLGGTEGFFSADFWSMYFANIFTVELWSQYVTDLLIAIVFTVLGAGSVIRDLFFSGGNSDTAEAKAKV
jgi:hypothetical protein